jgi:hypothetical protein
MGGWIDEVIRAVCCYIYKLDERLKAIVAGGLSYPCTTVLNTDRSMVGALFLVEKKQQKCFSEKKSKRLVCVCVFFQRKWQLY